jgi:hypothetical protein
MPTPSGKPDAVIYPMNFLNGDIGLRLDAAKLLFGPLFGSPRVGVRRQMGFNVAYPLFEPHRDAELHTAFSLGYAIDHPMAKTSRYLWFRADFDRPNRQFRVSDDQAFDHDDHQGGILIGWLKEDPHEDDEDLIHGIKATLNRTDSVRIKAGLSSTDQAIADPKPAKGSVMEKALGVTPKHVRKMTPKPPTKAMDRVTTDNPALQNVVKSEAKTDAEGD